MSATLSDLAKGAGAIALAGVALAILAVLLGSRKTSAAIHDVGLLETKLIAAAVDPAATAATNGDLGANNFTRPTQGS
jgi:hypothetical protein